MIYLFLAYFVQVIFGFSAHDSQVKNMSVVGVAIAGYGHVYPMISVLEELANRGHKVTLFIGDTDDPVDMPNFSTGILLFSVFNSKELVEVSLTTFLFSN